MKEAAARIKINKLLEAAGWRFFADGNGPANIQLELGVTLKTHDVDRFGEDFEKTEKGFVDFLLLSEKGFPLIVLEAKREDKNPLTAKEQARKYARSQNCRFVILSNGNLHYFWDLERGNPYVITAFPSPGSVAGYQKSVPDPKRLIEETVGDDYVVLTQRPGYAAEAGWKDESERRRFIDGNSLRFLRAYQLKAVTAIQQAVKRGSDRFLLEMATGTGKTLTSAAIIKLFLRTANASRVWSTASNWRTRPSRPSRKSSPTTTPPSSTRRTATTGAGPRSSSRRCSPFSSTTNTAGCFHPPTSILSFRTRRTVPLGETRGPFSITSSATSLV